MLTAVGEWSIEAAGSGVPEDKGLVMKVSCDD